MIGDKSERSASVPSCYSLQNERNTSGCLLAKVSLAKIHKIQRKLRQSCGATVLVRRPSLSIEGTGGIAAADVKHILPFMPHSTNIQKGPIGPSTGYHHGLTISQSSTTRETDIISNDPSLCLLLR